MNVTQRMRLEIFARDGFRCVYCGHSPRTGAALALDHINPTCNGGADDVMNYATSCLTCNLGKGGLLPAEILAMIKVPNPDEYVRELLQRYSSVRNMRQAFRAMPRINKAPMSVEEMWRRRILKPFAEIGQKVSRRQVMRRARLPADKLDQQLEALRAAGILRFDRIPGHGNRTVSGYTLLKWPGQ